MRRFSWVLGFCLVLFGSTALSAFAGPILINTLQKNQEILVDVNIKDGDLVQALTTLFNQTGYQVRIGPSVAGTIANLQFTQVPFEQALKRMLASANGALKFEKVDAIFYRVDSGDAVEGTARVPVAKPASKPEERRPEIRAIEVMLPPVQGAAGSTTPPAGAAGGEAAATAEKAWIGMITIYNLDMEYLCDILGPIAEHVPPFLMAGEEGTGTGTGSRGNRGGSGGRSSRSGRDSYYDDPYYNDRYNDPYNTRDNRNYDRNYDRTRDRDPRYR